MNCSVSLSRGLFRTALLRILVQHTETHAHTPNARTRQQQHARTHAHSHTTKTHTSTNRHDNTHVNKHARQQTRTSTNTHVNTHANTDSPWVLSSTSYCASRPMVWSCLRKPSSHREFLSFTTKPQIRAVSCNNMFTC